MNAEVKDYVVEKTHELMEAASCSKEAKEAAQAWLDALGTAAEAEETKKYIAELDVDTIDIGVPVLCMHAPMEIISKVDLYETHRGFYEFLVAKMD